VASTPGGARVMRGYCPLTGWPFAALPLRHELLGRVALAVGVEDPPGAQASATKPRRPFGRRGGDDDRELNSCASPALAGIQPPPVPRRVPQG